MIKIYIILLLSLLSFTNAQNYNPIANYNFNGTAVNGIKIKTSIPYSDGSQMPNIIIEGYNYGSMEPINLSLVWYIYGGNFINYGVTSTSSYTPEIKLSNEQGKVVIFINDRQYFTRFSVRGFAQGMMEDSSWFKNWTINDESLTGVNTVDLTYKNAFNQAKVFHQGTWKADGSVGIGTKTRKIN